MKNRILLSAFGLLVLASCSQGPSVPFNPLGVTQWRAGEPEWFGQNVTVKVAPLFLSDSLADKALKAYTGSNKPTSLLKVDYDNTKTPDGEYHKAYAMNDFKAAKDYSKAETLTFQLYNDTTDTVKAALALMTGEPKEWQESTAFEVKPGWNTIIFDLKASTFKAERSGWASNLTLRNMNQLREVGLLIYPNQKITGTILSDAPVLKNAGEEK
ncbi:hypothetical protein [Deinococcus cellulosilyticus]|uniref:Uncharacterized protein n=1 Tax=Deinococcus cellulosilyticus (strain DSM 18568 / NBRC 106333 / KACC 11606 / 5516J-15) TaxID=1223518 RepID=A0A511MV23_DEIC1|nr:hypothetical protein [Deinococcus cellulosilyticus]GEM44440.1 hypothetical protein DC3_00750 [Deinococcus cellulosilyticus NBRC 106333 = KACC 11606]